MTRALFLAAALLPVLAELLPAAAQSWSSRGAGPAWSAQPLRPAWSTRPLSPGERQQLWLRGHPSQIQAIERIDRSREIARQQQLNREIDRSVIGTAPMDLNVQIVRNNCMKRVFGNKFVPAPCG